MWFEIRCLSKQVEKQDQRKVFRYAKRGKEEVRAEAEAYAAGLRSKYF
jgi:hypothetical protein